MKMFSEGATIDVVAAAIKRAQSTVFGYLAQYIDDHQPSSVSTRVNERTFETVSAAIDAVGMDALRPIFVHLDEQVPYETIRIVATHLRVRCAAES